MTSWRKYMDKASEKGYLWLPNNMPKKIRHRLSEEFSSKCAEVRPFVVVHEAGATYAGIMMDTNCFGTGDLDEQACNEAYALFANIAKDKEFLYGRNIFEVKRVPLEDTDTLAKALINVALRSSARAVVEQQNLDKQIKRMRKGGALFSSHVVQH
jgi:hypothetical protein